MRRVLIDTNMLLVPGQFTLDIFTELDRVMDEPYETAILQGSLDELERIATGAAGAGAEDRRAARLAQLLIEHQRRMDRPAASRCKGLKILGGSRQKHT